MRITTVRWAMVGALASALGGAGGCDGPDEASPPGPVFDGDPYGDDLAPQSAGDDEDTDAGVESDSGSGGEDDGIPADVVPEACEGPAFHASCDDDGGDPFAAMGLGCDAGPEASIPIDGAFFDSPEHRAWAVATRFGGVDEDGEPYWGPREGDALLVISTGVLPEPDDTGAVVLPSTPAKLSATNDNPSTLGDLPTPMTHERGSAQGDGTNPFVDCDGVADCSDTLAAQWGENSRANDLLSFGFEVEVPGGVHGYAFDFAWFSAEFPEFVDSAYNDMFVAWQVSEAYTGNVTFVDNAPLTVTSVGTTVFDRGLYGDAPELVGTGFDGVAAHACRKQGDFAALDFEQCPLGGGTGWYAAKGPVVPGETVAISFALFDKADDVLDTVALLDNFRWDCRGCAAADPMDCSPDPV